MSDDRAMVTRLQLLAERVADLEVQVRALVESQTIEGKHFVLRDDRGDVRARLELVGYSPRVTFYDPKGTPRLSIGLATDGTPSITVDQREVLAGDAGHGR